MAFLLTWAALLVLIGAALLWGLRDAFPGLHMAGNVFGGLFLIGAAVLLLIATVRSI